MFSVPRYFDFFFPASGVGLVGVELKSPETPPLVIGALPRPHLCLVWVASN